MAGDPLKKVLPGQRLELPAGAFNAFMDAARYVRSHQHDAARDSAQELRQTAIVKIRNQTEEDLPRYAVLALGNPIIGPDVNLREFKNKVNFNGDKPGAAPLRQKPVVLLDPLGAGAIGRGILAGVTPVQIDVVRESDRAAELAEDETGHLRSTPYGQTQILWKEPGTGIKWAVVRLGDRPRFAVFELTGDWTPAVTPEPEGWAKMEGCKPALFFQDEGTYRADETEPGETLWHQVGFAADERDALVDLFKTTGVWSAKFGRGDWVWCIWNERESRWQILAPHEDHWRFELLTALNRCSSALAQLVLYRDGSWRPVNLTFTVHDSVGIVGAEGCAANASGSGNAAASAAPAGSHGIAKHFADSGKWEVLALGQGCQPPSSSYSSSGSSSAYTSSSSGSGSSSASGSSSGSHSSGSASSGSSLPGSSSSGIPSGLSGSSLPGSSSLGFPSGSSSAGLSIPDSSGVSSDSGTSPSSSLAIASSSSSSASSSSSSGAPASAVAFQETDVRCESGRLIVYRRTITLVLQQGALTKSEGPWMFSHSAGCCCCAGCSSGSSGSSWGSSGTGSSGSGFAPSSSLPGSGPADYAAFPEGELALAGDADALYLPATHYAPASSGELALEGDCNATYHTASVYQPASPGDLAVEGVGNVAYQPAAPFQPVSAGDLAVEGEGNSAYQPSSGVQHSPTSEGELAVEGEGNVSFQSG